MDKITTIDDAIWMEKYRPNAIQGMVLPIKLKNYFNKIITTKVIPNMIFHSVKPGSGKTSSAKALCRDVGMSNADYLYINMSLNRGIDTLRNDIEDYATTLSYIGGVKIAILDEFDGAGEVLQKAMRAAIEEFASTCRFILTCNNINKIIEPIRSRCELVDFNFMDGNVREMLIPSIYKRLINILKNENVEYNDDTVKKIAITYYPDIRHMVKLCQQYSTMYGMISDDIFKFRQVEEELITLIIERKLTAARKFIADKGYDFDTLYRFLFDSIVPKIEDKQKRAQSILIIDEYMRGSRDSIDKEITFTACIIRLFEVL